MPSFSEARQLQVVAAFGNLSLNSPKQELTDFVTSILGLNNSERNALLPEPDSPSDDERRIVLDLLASRLVADRKKKLEREGRVPNVVLFDEKDTLLDSSAYYIEGLIPYLRRNGQEENFINRLQFQDEVRAFVTGINDGFKLETLAAALLGKIFNTCYATRRSFDQGIDCVAGGQILELHSWCCSADCLTELSRVGERLHIVASCKANEGNTANGTPETINPAHVRELIGGWLIQRSNSGIWAQRAGVKLLSPMQLLLVTTYRLSDSSLSMCRELGVAVWGVPELVFLICNYSPPSVFTQNGVTGFSTVELDAWLNDAENARVGLEPA